MLCSCNNDSNSSRSSFEKKKNIESHPAVCGGHAFESLNIFNSGNMYLLKSLPYNSNRSCISFGHAELLGFGHFLRYENLKKKLDIFLNRESLKFCDM